MCVCVCVSVLCTQWQRDADTDTDTDMHHIHRDIPKDTPSIRPGTFLPLVVGCCLLAALDLDSCRVLDASLVVDDTSVWNV